MIIRRDMHINNITIYIYIYVVQKGTYGISLLTYIFK